MKHILGTQELGAPCVMASLKHWGSPIGGHRIRVPFLASLDNGPCPVICFGQWNKWEWERPVSLPASVFILTPSHAVVITGAMSWWRHSPPRALSDHHQQSVPIECVREWGANLCYVTSLRSWNYLLLQQNLVYVAQHKALLSHKNFIPVLFYSPAYACLLFQSPSDGITGSAVC